MDAAGRRQADRCRTLWGPVARGLLVIRCPAMRRSAVVLSLFALGLGACTTLPTFPEYGDDAGVECGTDGADCPSGEVCLQGRCVAACTASSCGPLETCAMGVCVPRAMGTDAGVDAPPRDTPPDPCMGVTCGDGTPYCRRGECVACTEVPGEEQCGGGTPICLVARNTCVAFAAGSICEPCNENADCVGGVCTNLGITALERVCLPRCMASCPAGTECDEALDVCRPAAAASCFQFRAALTGLACSGPEDCAPRGATFDDALFTGTCTGTCRYPCGVSADCPVGSCNPTNGLCE